ncbi:hypothetical protein QBC47DRAFT_380123 [Echria macrotheca]|uniref:Uncharacterized protein n=1 Tax=Echria macrotheca TaxID=438768 RepID=A0AAJ0BE31_9PEZI|nr:hypothetical protein QBC47DRAFT_380123 [Echria macrotheca]
MRLLSGGSVCLALVLGLVSIPTTAEPIPQRPAGEILAGRQVLTRAAAPNWTTQAWQTHCNNIDYFGDNNECCLHLSGSTWKSCNGVGWSTISSSGVLCYDLTSGHDCCDDDSVCDNNLPCSGGTCSQTTTSVTVCKSGCVSYNGLGCKDGDCVHGKDVGSGTTPTSSSGSDPAASGSSGGGTTTGSGTTPTGTETPTAPASTGLSTGDKIAIGIGVPVGFFTILGTIIACYTCK